MAVSDKSVQNDSNYGLQSESTIFIWWKLWIDCFRHIIFKMAPWMCFSCSSNPCRRFSWPAGPRHWVFPWPPATNPISSLLLTDPGLCSHPHYVQTSTVRMKPSSLLRSIIYRMDVSPHFTIVKSSWSLFPSLVCALQISTEGIRASCGGWGLISGLGVSSSYINIQVFKTFKW